MRIYIGYPFFLHEQYLKETILHMKYSMNLKRFALDGAFSYEGDPYRDYEWMDFLDYEITVEHSIDGRICSVDVTLPYALQLWLTGEEVYLDDNDDETITALRSIQFEQIEICMQRAGLLEP